jgi:hypothetical protein
MPRYMQVKQQKSRRRVEDEWEQPFPFPGPRVKTFIDELEEAEEPSEETED